MVKVTATTPSRHKMKGPSIVTMPIASLLVSQNHVNALSPSSALSRLSLSPKASNVSPSTLNKVPGKCKARRRLQTTAPLNNAKVTDYFPVRRGERKTKSKIIQEKQQAIQEAILSGNEDDFLVENLHDKGRAVIANRFFQKGEFVLEYHGELISVVEAKRREVQYSQDENKGCYMYYFTCRNNNYCIDATSESGRLGRLVNHSRLDCNLVTKAFLIGDTPHLILVAKRDIKSGEELLYDYGDRSRSSIMFHPWLAK